MLIKKLIQRLLDSRTTPEEAVHANRRNTSSGVIVSTNTPYVCPTDGYITFSSRTENGAGIGTAIGIKINGIDTDLRTYPVDTSWNQSLTHPVSKADTVTFLSYGNAEISAKFFKALGGGYNLFIWRALSCLRALSNFSQRSFCKAKNLGFQNNQLLLSIRALIFLAQAPRISLPTPHRATAGRLLGAIQLQSQLLKSKSRTGRWHLLPYLTETLRELESVVTLKKGHRLSSCAVAEVQPIILFGSTKQVQTFNPLTGGALC